MIYFINREKSISMQIKQAIYNFKKSGLGRPFLWNISETINKPWHIRMIKYDLIDSAFINQLIIVKNPFNSIGFKQKLLEQLKRLHHWFNLKLKYILLIFLLNPWSLLSLKKS